MEVFPSQMRTLQSPVDSSKSYHELNILYGNILDFGVPLAERTMMKQHTVTAFKRIQLSLDLSRRKLSLQFPMAIDGAWYKYKLEMPFAQLQNIYSAEDQEKRQSTLIIPFNTPPRFFRFAHGEEELAATFNPSDKVWRDTNAWYRQTDVLDDEMDHISGRLPVMNMKDAPVIDIGKVTTRLWSQ